MCLAYDWATASDSKHASQQFFDSIQNAIKRTFNYDDLTLGDPIRKAKTNGK